MLPFSSRERKQLACGKNPLGAQAAGPCSKLPQSAAGRLRSREQGTQTFQSVRPAEFYSADDAGRVAKAAG